MNTSIRSNSGNVFHYSKYFKTWSRVVWHRCKATEQQAHDLGIPEHVETIEVDLTGSTREDWTRIQAINIRFHCTPLKGDELHGALPAEVACEVSIMAANPYLSELLLHQNLLDVIDFSNSSKMVGGGIPLRQLYKDTLTR